VGTAHIVLPRCNWFAQGRWDQMRAEKASSLHVHDPQQLDRFFVGNTTGMRTCLYGTDVLSAPPLPCAGPAPPLGRLPAADRAPGSPPLPPLATAAALTGDGGGAYAPLRLRVRR